MSLFLVCTKDHLYHFSGLYIHAEEELGTQMAVVLERKEAEKKEGSKEMGESSSVRVSLDY